MTDTCMSWLLSQREEKAVMAGKEASLSSNAPSMEVFQSYKSRLIRKFRALRKILMPQRPVTVELKRKAEVSTWESTRSSSLSRNILSMSTQRKLRRSSILSRNLRLSKSTTAGRLKMQARKFTKSKTSYSPWTKDSTAAGRQSKALISWERSKSSSK